MSSYLLKSPRYCISSCVVAPNVELEANILTSLSTLHNNACTVYTLMPGRDDLEKVCT